MGQPPKSPWQPTLVSNPDTKLAAHGQGLSAPHLHGFQHSGQECSKPQKSITDFLTLTKLQKAIPKGQLVETRSAAVKYTHKETIKDMSSLKDTQDEAITYGKQQKKYKTIYLHLRSISSPGTDGNLSSIAPLCPGSFDRPASSFTTA